MYGAAESARLDRSEAGPLTPTTRVIEPEALDALVGALARPRLPRARPDRPRRRDRLRRARRRRPSCPIGWTDVQERRQLPARAPRRRGALRLRRRPALLEAVPAARRACGSGGRARRRRRASRSRTEPRERPPLAFIGVRSCDLHAIAIQDRVFLDGRLRRPRLRRPPRGRVRRRGQLLRARRHVLLRLDGHRPDGATAGYDLALTEILDGAHRFLVEVGQRARRARSSPSCRAARRPQDDLDAGGAAVERRGASRWAAQLDTADLARPARAQPRAPALGRGRRALPHLRQLHDGLPDLLLHERRGRHRPGRRRAPSACGSWDSCFSIDYSYIHGGSVRPTGALALPPVADAQVRHLARPVRHARAASAAAAASPGARSAIDVTEELAAIRATDREVDAWQTH